MQKRTDERGIPMFFDVDTDPAYTVSGRRSVSLIGVAACGILSLITAFTVCAGFQNQMKTARRKETAHAYMSPGGLTLTEREDRFLRATQTRQRIQNRSSGGGRGGTSVNRRGYSHRSGRF